MLETAPESRRTGLQFPIEEAPARKQAPLRLTSDQLMHSWSLDTSHPEAELRNHQQDDSVATCPPEVFIG